jgi:hypothetical protein
MTCFQVALVTRVSRGPAFPVNKGEKLMVKVALLVRLEAKPGKETAVAQFLEGALPLSRAPSPLR